MRRILAGGVVALVMAALVVAMEATAFAAKGELVVEPGDSSWSISEEHIGPGATPERIAYEVQRIFELNRDQIGENPNLIFPGQKLLKPAAPEEPAEEPAVSSREPPTEAQTSVSPPPVSDDVAWVDDEPPEGARVSGNELWKTVYADPTPFSGTRAHQSDARDGYHHHEFTGASAPLSVNRGERLFAYVYLDPANVPEEVILAWNDGSSWEHRAYWGADKIVHVGKEGTESRRYMGPLPPAGEWVRLEVSASEVGLEDREVNGMAFPLYGGRATWDVAGKAAG